MFFKQLPQHLLALFLIMVYRMKKVKTFDKTAIYSGNFAFGVSLGDYILIGKTLLKPVTICHELGHTTQSYKWGWLYLLVVGIPSATRNILTSWKILKYDDYFKKYPEKQADELGGVIIRHGQRTVLDQKKYIV